MVMWLLLALALGQDTDAPVGPPEEVETQELDATVPPAPADTVGDFAEPTELEDVVPEEPAGEVPEGPFDGSTPLPGFEAEPAEAEAEADEEEERALVRRTEEGLFEVVVWGEDAVREARGRVVDEMEELGWEVVSEGEDIVFRPPHAWMGRARLDRDGLLSFGRPIVAFNRADAANLQGEYDDFEAVSRDRTSGVFVPQADVWILPSRRKLDKVHAAVAEAVEEEVRDYRLVLQETAAQERLYEEPPP